MFNAIRSLEYPVCPYCGTSLNDPGIIPLSTVWMGHAPAIRCPGAYGAKEKCGKKIHIRATISVKFEAIGGEKDEPSNAEHP